MMRALVLLPFAALGCNAGLGVAQTAKTVDSGGARMSVGFSGAFNEYDRERGGPGLANFSFEPAWRVGLGRQTDLGFGPWLAYGMQLDVKHELTPRAKPYGVALRGGFGASAGSPTSYSGLLGAIGSYELASGVAPYASVAFRNFWFYEGHRRPAPTDGSRWAERNGWGDGLLQMTAGFRFGRGRSAFYLEYARWQPVQNDPGDFFKLAASHVFSFTVGFCLDRWCRQG